MNPLMRAVLGWFAAPRLNMREDYEKVRRAQRGLAAIAVPPTRARDWETVEDENIFPVPVRIFRPKETRRNDVVVFFHGGGWVTGDIDSYTPACTTMADLMGCVVASVDYRLAPEHPFPAGLDDCYRVARKILDQPELLDAQRPEDVILMGDSAGGNLAAVVAMRLRDRGETVPSRQILLYPVTQWDHDPQTSPFDSVREHGEDLRLTNTEVQDYLELYVPDSTQRRDPEVSPLAAENFSDLPRTLMITAGLDLLRDEGEAFAAALAEAGNDVVVHRVERALHGFITLPRFSRSLREAYEQIDAFLEDPTRAP
ncbi:MAG: alpha/beta hydrolase [Micrococcaceae bacterium]